MKKKFISILIALTFFIGNTGISYALRPMAVEVSTERENIIEGKVGLTETPDSQLLEKMARVITKKLAKDTYFGMVRPDDIYNCAFQGVWEAWLEYDPEKSPLEFWLRTNGLQRTQDALRADGYVERKSLRPRPKRRPLSTAEKGDEALLYDAECVVDTRERVSAETVEARLEIEDMQHLLSPAAQMIIKFLYHDEMTQREVSLLLGKSKAAISELCSKIKESLRQGRYLDLVLRTSISLVSPGYGQRIRRARMNLFMSQKDLDVLLGVYYKRAYAMEKEKLLPTFNYWFFLAHLLHVPVTYLLWGVDEPDWETIQRKYLKPEHGWGKGIQDLQKEAAVNFREVDFSEQVEEVYKFLAPFKLKAKLGRKEITFAPIPKEAILYPEKGIRSRPSRPSRISQVQKLSTRKKLNEQLGIPKEKIRQYPEPDALDFEKIILPRWKKLIERLGIPEEEIRQLPLLLLLDFESHIFPNWEKLTGAEKGQLNIPEDEIRHHPSLLTLDFEGNILPTYCYLLHVASISKERIKESPMYLTESLNHKIRPRAIFLLLNGEKVNATSISVYRTRFKKWLTTLGLSQAKYEAFLKEYYEKERLFDKTEAYIRKGIAKFGSPARKRLKIDMVWLRIFFDEYIIAHAVGLRQAQETLQKVRSQIEAMTDRLPAAEKASIRKKLLSAVEESLIEKAGIITSPPPVFDSISYLAAIDSAA